MTNEDRQILIDNCGVMKQLVECQRDQDEAWRFLAQALQEHFPNLKEEYQAARQKGSLFATVSSVALDRLVQNIDRLIQCLKHPAN